MRRAALICARSHWERKGQLSKRDIKLYLEGRHAKTDGLNSLDAGEKPISERHLCFHGWHPAAKVGEEDYQTKLPIPDIQWSRQC